jgi:Mor family transcriptional regulator
VTAPKHRSAIGAVSNEFVNAVEALLVASLTRSGIAVNVAANAAIFTMSQLRKEFGGQELYFPKGCADEAAKRDEEIFERVTKGDPLAKIVLAFGVTGKAARRAFNREKSRQCAANHAGGAA